MHSKVVDCLNKVEGANPELLERAAGDKVVFVAPKSIYASLEALKNYHELDFNVLQVITGCDYEDRIEVSYIIANFFKGHELILKTKVGRDEPKLASVVGLWKSANFQERECFDMLGVTFEGHPDHRRILCPDDWEGFPLRKDYKAQEVYNGMTVYPEAKMNFPEREFVEVQKQAEADGKEVERPEIKQKQELGL